jgi:hypothetical protein
MVAANMTAAKWRLSQLKKIEINLFPLNFKKILDACIALKLSIFGAMQAHNVL